jgi:hypothetical protein
MTTPMRRGPRASAGASDGDHEGQYDLLTAALMGMALGAGITYVLRRGPSGRRPMSPALSGAGRGLAWAGRNAWKAGTHGASWAGERGGELWDKVPRDEIRHTVGKTLENARETIDDAVESELRALRRSIRRRRKQLGL